MTLPTLKSLLETTADPMEEARLHFSDFMQDVLATDKLRQRLIDELNVFDAAVEEADGADIDFAVEVKGRSLKVVIDVCTREERALCDEMGSPGRVVKVIDGSTPTCGRSVLSVSANFLMQLALNDLTDEPLEKTFDEFLGDAYVTARRTTSVLSDSRHYKSHEDPNSDNYDDGTEDDEH